MSENAKYNPEYLHHKHSSAYLYGREIVFGMQDGMVSLLGALTGIAVGSHNYFTIVLSGLAIIFTSALSMAIGTYNSLNTERKIQKRILTEEREEIEKNLSEEKGEVENMFRQDGWPKELAEQMANYAAKDSALMLQEMAYRELHIFPQNIFKPINKSIIMFFSWMLGGLFPLIPYLMAPISSAIFFSIFTTICGLLILGGLTSKFTKQNAVSASLEMGVIGSTAMLAGYIIGHFVEKFITR